MSNTDDRQPDRPDHPPGSQRHHRVRHPHRRQHAAGHRHRPRRQPVVSRNGRQQDPSRGVREGVADVAPDGTSSLITSGWLRASHRLNHETPELLSPGKPYDVVVRLWATHWRLTPGHRLRVSVSSGDLASIEPNAPPGTVTVFLGVGGSSIDLPRQPV